MTQDEINKKAEGLDIDAQLSWLSRVRYFFQEAEDAPYLEAIHRSLKKIKIINESELTAAEVEKPKTRKRKHPEFADAYTTFVQFHSQIGARISTADEKALARIVAYLTEQSKQKNEAGALAAWKYILSNWTKLSPWLQKQIALTSIDKHILEILTTLRNGNSKSDASRKTETNLKARINQKRAGQ